MDNQLGFGAFKFQNAVQRQIRSSRDISNSSGKRQVIEQKLSVIEKSKKQLKPPREQPPVLFITNKIRREYVLNVSSSSSSSASESEQDKRIQATHLVQKLKLAMVSNTLNKGAFTPQPSPQRYNDVPKITQQRRQITFLRGLSQNQELNNCEQLALDEYKVDKQIFVDIDSNEIMTFLRLQHEVEEMRRKQNDFQHQKERHFDYQRNKKPVEEKKEDFWTVLMAKRTAKKLIKNMNLKRLTPNIAAHPQ